MKGASRTALPALALVASLLVAQTSERPPEPPTGSIRGRVVSSTDGTPIRGAVVSIENAQPVLAGAKGRFLMEGAPSGSQVVLAYKSGYRRHQGRVAVPAEDETEIEISLLPFAAVAGKIMGPEGEPLQGHTVAAYADRGRMNRPARSKDRQSDDHGRYRLFGLVGGRYWFVVEAKPLPGVAGRTSYVFLPAFYPNTTNPAEAYPMEIRSGAKFEGLDFRLREAPATLFRGEVEMADTRAPCGNCPFTLYRRSGEIYWRVGTHNTAPNGSFAIAGLAPGLYTLAGAPHVERLGELRFFSAEVTVDADSPTRTVIKAYASLDIQVRMKLDDPPPELFEEGVNATTGVWARSTGAPIFAGHVGIAFVPLEEGASNRVQGVVPRDRFRFGSTIPRSTLTSRPSA